jgi:hypothetical protein
MKHENISSNELFYYLYLLLHTITTIPHTLVPMTDKFLKAIKRTLSLARSFFIFGKKVKGAGNQAWMVLQLW